MSKIIILTITELRIPLKNLISQMQYVNLYETAKEKTAPFVCAALTKLRLFPSCIHSYLVYYFVIVGTMNEMYSNDYQNKIKTHVLFKIKKYLILNVNNKKCLLNAGIIYQKYNTIFKL